MELNDDVCAAATDVLNLVKRRLELKKRLVEDVYRGPSLGSAAFLLYTPCMRHCTYTG